MRVSFLQRVLRNMDESIIEMINGDIDSFRFELNETPYQILVEKGEGHTFPVSLIEVLEEEDDKLIYTTAKEYVADNIGNVIFQIDKLCDEIAYKGREIKKVEEKLIENLSHVPGFKIEIRCDYALEVSVHNRNYLLFLDNDWILKTSFKLLHGRTVSKCKNTTEVIYHILDIHEYYEED